VIGTILYLTIFNNFFELVKKEKHMSLTTYLYL